MAQERQEENPISTLFGVVGALVGFGYGAQFSGGDIFVAFAAALIGLGLGKFVGAIVFRLLLIALMIVGFLIRDQIFSALAETMFQ